MALPLISPAITKTRQAIVENSQRAILRIVPELERGERVTNRSFAILVTIGLLAISLSMFVISALSTQDAFTLAKLQRQAQTLSDQKDAINREIAFKSSASALAADARKLGMGPDGQPRFIEISGASNG
jgi:cell division protein FtsB